MFLQAAGNAVKRASDNLVKAAQKAAFDAQDDQAVVVKSKMVGGIAQVRKRSQTHSRSTNSSPEHVIHVSLQLCEDVPLFISSVSDIYYSMFGDVFFLGNSSIVYQVCHDIQLT